MEVFYWNNKKGQEVDFVLKSGDNGLSCINVSYANDVDEREVVGLLEFEKEFSKCKDLVVLTRDLESVEKFDKVSVKFVPVWKWLLEE